MRGCKRRMGHAGLNRHGKRLHKNTYANRCLSGQKGIGGERKSSSSSERQGGSESERPGRFIKD